MKRWTHLTTISLGIVATLFAMDARSEELKRRSEDAGQPEETAHVRSQLRGVVKPVFNAVLRSPTSGIVSQIPVKEGQVVQKGEPLLLLDDTIAKAAVATAQVEAKRDAQIRIAEIALLQAKAKLNHLRSAVKQNAASQFELDVKVGEYEAALANRDLQLELQELARTRLAEATAVHESLVLKAPFTGQVIKIHANLGDSIDASRAAISIVQLDQLEVELHLPVELFGKVFSDREYELQAYSPVNRSLEATIQFVSPIIEPTSGTFRCVFRFDNSEYSLPAGFQVRFVGESKAKHVAGVER